MNLARKLKHLLPALAALGLTAALSSTSYADMTVSTTAPTPGAADISQLSNAGNSGGPDALNYYTDNYTAHGNPNPGQTFTTGSNSAGYNFNSLSVQVADVGNGNGIGAPLTLYLDSISGTTATLISSTDFTSPGFNIGDWATFTLPSAQVLSANSTYAYAIGDTSGILYSSFANSNLNPYSGGQLAEIGPGGGPVIFGSSGNYDATFNLGLTNAVVRNSFGLKFGSEQSSGASALLATDVAGVIPQSNWNNLTGATGTSIPINDSTGTLIPGASVSFSGTNTYYATTDTSTPNKKLLDGYLDNSNTNNTDSVSVSGIQYAKYDVYAYVGSGGAGRTGSVTIGGTTYNYKTVGDPGGVFTQTTDTTGNFPNADFAIFSGLTGSSFTMTQNLTMPSPFNSGIFGLQVVDTSPVPEASQGAAFGLCLLGLMGVALKARKRKVGGAIE